MKVIFRFQDVIEVVNENVPALAANATDVQQTTHKELKKKNGKAMFLIHQSGSNEIFEKIMHYGSAKETWDAMEKLYFGDDKLKKVINLTNHKTRNGETFTDVMKVEKVLKTLTPRFDHIVVALEESKDLDSMKIEEMQATECRSKRVPRSKDEPQFAHNEDSDSDEALLMATVKEEEERSDEWYLDTGCSNHRTRKKSWFSELDDSANRKIRFADNSIVCAVEIWKVLIHKKDGKKAYITDVLYVPSMKNNLINIGQLLQKGYTMKMEAQARKVFDSKNRLILKAQLSKQRTF
ncbi:uncharacterized protein LOC131633297 [Vicia villosa]|uniref:uncharacterized protein LOC131633297 n=1 Tax=Vicia villosa TaxID=3911 RepID=UPI00273BE6BB|nr:uncharacterized protein LOC131633297 [Vicia villosa]